MAAPKATNGKKHRKLGHGAATIDNSRRSVSAAARRAGGGTGDPGRHRKGKDDTSPKRETRKGRAGTTTAGRDRRAGSGGLAPTMKNKQVAPSRATSAAEGSATRKSTRKSANRVKADSNLTRREQREVRAPKSRATRARVERIRPRG